MRSLPKIKHYEHGAVSEEPYRSRPAHIWWLLQPGCCDWRQSALQSSGWLSQHRWIRQWGPKKRRVPESVITRLPGEQQRRKQLGGSSEEWRHSNQSSRGAWLTFRAWTPAPGISETVVVTSRLLFFTCLRFVSESTSGSFYFIFCHVRFIGYIDYTFYLPQQSDINRAN